jgi:hypothetical protein
MTKTLGLTSLDMKGGVLQWQVRENALLLESLVLGELTLDTLTV